MGSCFTTFAIISSNKPTMKFTTIALVCLVVLAALSTVEAGAYSEASCAGKSVGDVCQRKCCDPKERHGKKQEFGSADNACCLDGATCQSVGGKLLCKRNKK